MKLGRAARILAVALGVLAAPLAAEAQQSGEHPVIGLLLVAGSPQDPILEAFREALRERGYVEERNIAIVLRFAEEGKFDRLPALAADLAERRVDVIVADSTPAIRAAKEATTTIPIVMAVSADPVGTGLVASLARPGGNVTGLSLVAPELSAKRLQILKEASPKVSRVTVLWNPANPSNAPQLREADVAARSVGVRLQSMAVRDPQELGNAFVGLGKRRRDALMVIDDPMFFRHRARIAGLATANRLPSIYGMKEFVDEGGLMSYGASIPDLFRRAAGYVDKILKGAKPADLPVEQPTKFELVINMKTAEALGLTIPQSILVRADHVIR